RKQELAELRVLRREGEAVRVHYQRLWSAGQDLQADLGREKRVGASARLALERYRQETLTPAPDSARADARINRLERRDRARLEREGQELAEHRRALQAEAARLGTVCEGLRQREDRLAQSTEELASLQADLEGRHLALADESERRQQETDQLRAL